MATFYKTFKDIGLIVVTSSGPGTYDEVMDMLARLQADPDFSLSYDVFWDATGRTTPFNSDDALKLADSILSYKGDKRPKRAFLVSKDVHYGMLRVYESYRYGKSLVDIEVFKDRGEALKWLGLENDPRL